LLAAADAPLLLALGTDDAATGGCALEQAALSEAVVQRISAGLPCGPSLGSAPEAAARSLFAAAGVRSRGSLRPAAQYVTTTVGLPPLAAESLAERLALAAQRALARWSAAGGAGAAGITHLLLGSTTPPRCAPGPPAAPPAAPLTRARAQDRTWR